MDTSSPIASTDFQWIFTQLVESSIGALDGFAKRELPDQVAEKSAGKNKFRAQFCKGDTGEFRSVLITGPRVNIVNMFFFPAESTDLPIFAMEYVVLGKRPVVAVVDLVDMDASPSGGGASLLEKARGLFPNISNGVDTPAWYEESRSGSDFFVRPESEETMLEMCDVHEYVFRLFSDMIDSAEPCSWENLSAERKIWIQGYKEHHRTNSPGIPFLNRSFGSDWTEMFLKEYLFK